MSDPIYAEMKRLRIERRDRRLELNLEALRASPAVRILRSLGDSGGLRVEVFGVRYDFWPSTGRFLEVGDPLTKAVSGGVRALVAAARRVGNVPVPEGAPGPPGGSAPAVHKSVDK